MQDNNTQSVDSLCRDGAEMPTIRKLANAVIRSFSGTY